MDYGAVLMDTEIIEKIKFVLKDKIAPSVAAHGGKIEFKSFEDGKLKLMMAGSCAGCAMSQLTLKQGVESMMKHYVPEVTHIESEDDPTAKEQGYTPYA
tara:strand:- start:2022 stop:2318 length:297 start_codon:yes stop_codon:yes gene_type:complete